MTNQILDEEFTGKENSPNQKSWKNWIALTMLWLGIVSCIFTGLVLDFQVQISLFFLVGATILTYTDYEKGVKLTFGIILLGVFHILRFFTFFFGFDFSPGPLKIGFNLILIFIGLIHYSTNKPILSPYFERIMNKKESKEDIQLKERAKINRYRHQFRNRDLDELKEIVNNEKLLPEAIKAAEELLKEKNTPEN